MFGRAGTFPITRTFGGALLLILRDSLPPPCCPLRIQIHQRADHSLIGYPALFGLAFEEIERAFRQRQCYLHIVLPRHKAVGGRQKNPRSRARDRFPRGVFNGFAAQAAHLARAYAAACFMLAIRSSANRLTSRLPARLRSSRPTPYSAAVTAGSAIVSTLLRSSLREA